MIGHRLRNSAKWARLRVSLAVVECDTSLSETHSRKAGPRPSRTCRTASVAAVATHATSNPSTVRAHIPKPAPISDNLAGASATLRSVDTESWLLLQTKSSGSRQHAEIFNVS